MPGRERQRVIRDWLKQQTRKDQTPLAYVVERLENGEFLQDIAMEIMRETQYEIPQHALRRWLIDQFGKENVLSEFEAARRIAADQHAADGYEILADVREVRECIDKAKAKSEYKRWLASTGNRERYGNSSGANVSISVNVAQLHLDALRSRSILRSTEGVARLTEGAEVLTDGEEVEGDRDVQARPRQ